MEECSARPGVGSAERVQLFAVEKRLSDFVKQRQRMAEQLKEAITDDNTLRPECWGIDDTDE
ncbi:MAG: hypothetical protein ABJB97_09895 [Acidobacteriota bacterium]